MHSFRALCVSLALVAVSASAALSPSLPTVDQVYPQSATVGASIDVALEGNYLDGVQSVRPEDDSLQAELLDSTFTRVRLRISSRSGGKPGLYALRLITPRGISNAFRFRLTGWESIYEQEPNNRQSQATPVEPERSINGVIEHVGDSDFYRFRAEAGEALAFNMLMGRNGYANAGESGHFTLTLLSPKGVVLKTGFGRFLMDPYFVYRFASEGDYYLVVNHSRMAVTCLENECDNRRLWEPYQLLLGRMPVLLSLWPNVAKPGSRLDARLVADFVTADTPLVFSDPNISGKIVGPTSGGGHQLQIEIGAGARPGISLVTAPDSSGGGNALAFLVEGSDFRFDAEPNDTREASRPLEAPAVIVGRMDHRGDVDSFQFTPTGTEAVSFRLEARNLGSSLVDPSLNVLCKEGDLAVANDDDSSFRNARNRDSYLEFKAADAGACMNREEGFYLQVRDSSKRFGEDAFYVLRVSKAAPGFTLGVRRDRVTLEAGKSNKIPVEVRRRNGFTGEVRVTAAGLPEGVEATPLTLAAGQTTGEMEWRIGADAPHTPFPLKLMAEAEIDGKPVKQAAVLAQPMPGDGPGYVQIAESTAWASVIEPVQFALDRVPPPGAGFALDRHLLSMRGDRRARVLVRIERAPECASEMTFAAEGLPPGVVIETQRPAEDGKAVEIRLKAESVDIPAGEYRITIAASIKRGSSVVTEATKAFYLRVEH